MGINKLCLMLLLIPIPFLASQGMYASVSAPMYVLDTSASALNGDLLADALATFNRSIPPPPPCASTPLSKHRDSV